MKEYWSKLKEWWITLAAREKKAVASLGAFLGIFIVYAWIWSPIYNAVLSERARIQSQQKNLLWMQAADDEIKKIEGQASDKSKTVTPVVLLGILQKQVSEAELEQHLTQLKQANNDSIEMHFQKVEFDKVVRLLTAVIKEHAVSISQMSVINDDTPGIVNVDVTLKLDG